MKKSQLKAGTFCLQTNGYAVRYLEKLDDRAHWLEFDAKTGEYWKNEFFGACLPAHFARKSERELTAEEASKMDFAAVVVGRLTTRTRNCNRLSSGPC